MDDWLLCVVYNYIFPDFYHNVFHTWTTFFIATRWGWMGISCFVCSNPCVSICALKLLLMILPLTSSRSQHSCSCSVFVYVAFRPLLKHLCSQPLPLSRISSVSNNLYHSEPTLELLSPLIKATLLNSSSYYYGNSPHFKSPWNPSVGSQTLGVT